MIASLELNAHKQLGDGFTDLKAHFFYNMQKKPGTLELAAIIVCQLLWFKAVSSSGLLSDKCVSSVEGVALLRHTYKSLVVRDMFACYYRCKDDALCQSLNFYRDSSHCELNNRTRTVRWTDSVPHRNAFYLDNPFRGMKYIACVIKRTMLANYSLA